MLPDTEAVTDAVLPLMVSHNNRVLPSASLWYIKVLPFSDSYQKPILETIDSLYVNNPIEEFMAKSFDYCRKHELEIRAHIEASENR